MPPPGAAQLFLCVARRVPERDELSQKQFVGASQVGSEVGFGGVWALAEFIGKFLEDSHAVENNLYSLSV